MADEHPRMVLPTPATGQRGIGRGLAAILANAPSSFNGLRELPLDAVGANPRQPRRDFDTDALLALSESIRVHGVLQPVVVRPLADGRFELVAGERRLRAARMAALTTTIIRWGYWRMWDRMDDVIWQHVVMLDTKVVHEATLTGEGSCPLIPMRFNPSPEWAFGNGPTIECLPDFRSLDDIEGKKMAHIDLTLAPPFTYPDDSSTKWGDLESAKGYPVRPGTADDVKNIFDPGSMQPAIYEVAEKERSCRHRHFLDWPEQRGDTPPTATQWLDEMQLAQRRFGTPGASFWREGPAEIFLRYKFLLTQRQIIKPIQVDGKTVSLQPYNPAQRAAEQQEVMMFARFAEIVAPLLPEEWKIETDGKATMLAVAEKMRVTGLWKQRSEADKKQALAAIVQLTESRQQVRPGDPASVGQQ